MPASSPWLEQAAPPQWHFAYAGPERTLMNAANNTAVDTTLHWKLSGTIIIALLIVFGLQAMGFRFVTSANVSLGVGR